jgi:phthalate 4,5-cis-dihydrodiol dehydrogenase
VPDRKLRMGLAGLGRGFVLMLPALSRDPRIELVAAATPSAESRERFVADFGGRAYGTVEELCADSEIDATYVATPHQFHADHVTMAARCGKHVLVEKPMALSVEQCQMMIDEAARSGVKLVVGHSHSFDRPMLRTLELVRSGRYGQVRMIQALNFTNFLYRPRRPEELDAALGGGVVFNQAPHQIDIVRLLGGGMVRSVRAATGSWDPARPVDAAYSGLLTFESGAFASISYSGYAHFDSDEFCDWIGETGQPKSPTEYGAARRALQHLNGADGEAALKAARTYGGAGFAPPSDEPRHYEHFGLTIVSCDHADLRPTPKGILIYEDFAQRLDPLTQPSIPRLEVIDEFYDAVVLGRPSIHTGEWGLATMEVCLAIHQSARQQKEIFMHRQVGVPNRDGPDRSGLASTPSGLSNREPMK